MSKRILIIGASTLQVPAIETAKRMGLEVAVADYNPAAVGVALADRYYNASTIDEEAVYEAARDFGADGIVTLATDMPMRSLAFACEKLGLPGLDYASSIKATDKGEMIRAFEAAGVAHPRYRLVRCADDLEEVKSRFEYPFILKPTDNSGSRGVVLVKGPEELEAAYSYSTVNGRSGALIAEEYMRGPEVSVEILVTDGKPHIVQVTDKLTTGAPHFVEMGHSQPSELNEDDLVSVKDLASRAALAVGVENGPAHAEIIVTKDGPKMVEIGARLGGDCITTHLVPLSTGIDMVEETIRIALGEQVVVPEPENHGSAIRYINAPMGIVKAIEGVDEAAAVRDIRAVNVLCTIGDHLGGITSSASRAGNVIAQSETAKEAVRTCDEALKHIRITTDQEPGSSCPK